VSTESIKLVTKLKAATRKWRLEQSEDSYSDVCEKVFFVVDIESEGDYVEK
jgi:hypothetical protein